MTESSNNKNYSAADIERYHAGNMPAVEMHALEKAAMEDPFLADALEGYAFAASPQQDLDLLREKLFGQDKKEKAIPVMRRNYSWLRAAAVIIFIAGGAWLAFRLTDRKKNEIAVQNGNNSKTITTDTLRETSEQGTFGSLKPDSTNTSTASASQDSYDLNFSTTIKNKPSPLNNKPSAGAEAKDSKTVYYSESNRDSVTDLAAVDKAAPALEKTAGVISVTDSLTLYRNDAVTFNNTNINATSPNVKMTLPGYNNVYKPATKKDSNEAENLFTKESKSKNHVSNDTISNLNIVLQADNAGLSEVIVSSGKKQEAGKRSFEIKVDTLEPTEGWARFDDYIARNIQVPDELKSKQPLSGEVELSFDVNNNGEPVNISVTKSLCEKCDQEAIRLLKEGPKWKKKKTKKGKVTIRF
jgi:hypothetical protein